MKFISYHEEWSTSRIASEMKVYGTIELKPGVIRRRGTSNNSSAG